MLSLKEMLAIPLEVPQCIPEGNKTDKIGIENPIGVKNKIPHAHRKLQYWNATTMCE